MDEDRCWQAVQAHDRAFDGAFVYAVRSTGIYCRPSCPSRRPRRNQVVFFPLPEAAEQAGFRPCRRCRPREAPAGDPQVEMVRRTCRYIEAHIDEPLTLAALSVGEGVSPHHLQRTFRRVMGITPRQYADACRLARLKAGLKESENVSSAQYAAGYGSSSRLYERAPAQMGMTPAIYRKGGPGVRIRYTIADTPLGRMLVAATGRGICAVSLGDADAVLEKTLRDEFPAAQILRDEAGLSRWVGAMLRHLNGREPHLDLPLDVRATAFQWRVWQELRAIPAGATRTYSAIARALGKPTAARAVARAVATNPVAVVIPCHRAIREDGGLAGYRWGVQRKRTLLERERAAAAHPPLHR